MRLLTPIALALALTTLASQGQISFGPSREISNFINYPQNTQAVDMDGDGDLDVISREATSVRVIWWENDGQGNFPQRHVWTWGGLTHKVVSLADSNADGRPDVWIRELISKEHMPPYKESYRYRIALSDLEGGFGEPEVVGDFDYQYEEAFINTSVRVIDMNHDGRADLLMSDGVWMRQTDGSFLPPAAGTSQPGRLISELGGDENDVGHRILAIDDFDGDGDLDLAFGAPGLMISFNLGDGMLAPPVSAGFMRPDEKVDYLKSIPAAAGEQKARLLISASLTYPESESPALRLALGSFSAGGDYTATAVQPLEQGVLCCTWDAGADRVIVASFGVPISVESQPPLEVTSFALDSAGTGLIKAPLFQTDGGVDEISMGDLDGDGIVDLLFPLSALPGIQGTFAGELRWYSGDESGTYTQMPSISQPAVAGEIAYAGDVDGDGDSDVITVDKPPLFFSRIANGTYVKVVLWENEGEGTSFKHHLLTEQDAVGVIAVSDREGDGDQDLLIQTFDYLGTFDDSGIERSYGTFRLAWLVQGPDGAFLESVEHEDISFGLLENAKYLDWDGNPQLTHGPPLRDVVGIYLGLYPMRRAVYFRGVGTGFGPMEYLQETHEADSGNWDDLDHDGDPDFSWIVDYSPSYFSFWLQNNGGEVRPAQLLPRTFFPIDADVDGDGFNDHFGEEGVLLSRPDFSFSSLPFPEDWNQQSSVGLVDLDSDGDLDILWEIPTQGIAGYTALAWYENDGFGFREARPVAEAIPSPRNEHRMADMDGDGIKDLVVQSGSWELRLEWFKVSKQPAPADFSAWIGSKALKGSLAGPLSDGDRDGITNWEEFVFGSDPGVADPNNLVRPRLEKQGSSWKYSYQQRIGLVVPPRVQISTDLKVWEDSVASVPSMQVAAPGYEWISKESAGEEMLFFRTVIPGP